jgi:hypothetical protein
MFTTPTRKSNIRLTLDDFLNSSSVDDTCQEEYFELKHKYDSLKSVNGKIYNYALEKIFNS